MEVIYYVNNNIVYEDYISKDNIKYISISIS